jgi:hypothetical protein
MKRGRDYLVVAFKVLGSILPANFLNFKLRRGSFVILIANSVSPKTLI